MGTIITEPQRTMVAVVVVLPQRLMESMMATTAEMALLTLEEEEQASAEMGNRVLILEVNLDPQWVRLTIVKVKLITLLSQAHQACLEQAVQAVLNTMVLPLIAAKVVKTETSLMQMILRHSC